MSPWQSSLRGGNICHDCIMSQLPLQFSSFFAIVYNPLKAIAKYNRLPDAYTCRRETVSLDFTNDGTNNATSNSDSYNLCHPMKDPFLWTSAFLRSGHS